ncbi:GIY-YIG nuclease family protein [Kiloniella sp. b19]|uniref:GIY-YIG nuclease family protein n=1 Tax=Kiloniella sp. GXU_MW_B19 TaxID=3141326 RepID=UPI0031E201CE
MDASTLSDQQIGRTIQLYLVDGNPDGLVIASLYGWTGSIIVARNATLPQLLKRPEAKRTGVYLLYGPDPEDDLKGRAYIGEADAIDERLPRSAGERGFWELAAIITTSDESLTKAHVRYLEAELLRLTKQAGRVTLDNSQTPDTERRHLPEADKANMFGFLKNIETILPVVGFDLLKPRARAKTRASKSQPTFVIEQKSGVTASMIEVEGEYLVKKGSLATKDAGYAHNSSYGTLRQNLIEKGRLVVDGEFYRFADDTSFKSPSAAAAVVLDRSSNGRYEWKLKGTKRTYDDWQKERSEAET